VENCKLRSKINLIWGAVKSHEGKTFSFSGCRLLSENQENNMATIRKSSRVVFIAFIFIFSISAAVCTAAPLKQDAENALKKGLAAIEQKEWPLAIRYLEEARKIEPNDPEIIFNLGLAESKISGHEMRAIAFSKMYLAADSNAAHAGVAKEQIVNMEVKIEVMMNKTLSQAQSMVPQFSGDYEKWSAISKIGVAQAKSGDLSGAKQTALQLPGKADSQIAYIAKAVAEAGDITLGKEILGRIEGAVWRSHVYQEIAVLQANAGDIAGAQYTLSYATYPGYKHNGLIAIARAQAKAGKDREAKQTLISAIDSITANTQSYDKAHCSEYHSVGKAQNEIGDFEGALQTANMINQADKSIFDYKANLITDIGQAVLKSFEEKFKAGDIKAATKLAIRNPHRYSKYSAMLKLKHFDICADLIDLYDNSYRWKFELYGRLITAMLEDKKPDMAKEIAVKAKESLNQMDPYTITVFIEALLKLNDLDGVRRAIPRIPKDSWSKNSIMVSYAKALANAGDIGAARQAAAEMKDGYEKNGILENIVAYQLKNSDLPGAAETAKMISDEYYKSGALNKIIDKYLADNNYNAAMRTINLLPNEAKKGAALKTIAGNHAKDGNFEEALRIAELIKDTAALSDAYKDIAYQQMQAGDFKGARKSSELIPKTDKKIESYINIISYLYSSGYRKAIHDNIATIRSLIESMSDSREQAQFYGKLVYYIYYYSDTTADNQKLMELAAEKAAAVADAQKRSELYTGYDGLYENYRRTGNYTAAREAFWSALDAASLIKSGSWEKKYRYSSLSSLQVTAGDFLGARRTADAMEDNDYREGALAAIAKAKVGYGDFRQAEEAMNEISSANKKDEIRLEILKKQAEGGKIADANKTLALIVNKSTKDSAGEHIAIAYLKAGNKEAAKAILAKLPGDPGYKIFEEMTKAGEMAWAYQAFANLKSDSWKQYFLKYITQAEAKRGNIIAAKKAAEQITDKWHQTEAYEAVAEAGDVRWALGKAGEIKDGYYRVAAKSRIAKMLFKKGNAARAKEIANELRKMKMTTSNRLYYVVNLLSEMGETAAAREQLLLIHPQDDEFESWAAYTMAGYVPENLKKQAIEKINDNFWKSKILHSRALYPPKDKKDKEAQMREFAAAIPDLHQRNLVYLELARRDAREGNFNAALDWAGMLADNNFKLLAISEITYHSVNRGGLHMVIPKLNALPDSLGKAYIIIDAANALAQQGKPQEATTLLNVGVSLVNAEPDKYWKARALMEISRIAAVARDEKTAADTKSLAEQTAGRLKEKEKQSWLDFIAQSGARIQQIATGKPAVKGDIAQQNKDREAINKKLEKWRYLLNYELAKPMFLDIQSHLQAVNAKTKPWDVFSGLIEIVETNAETLKKMKALEAEK